MTSQGIDAPDPMSSVVDRRIVLSSGDSVSPDSDETIKKIADEQKTYEELTAKPAVLKETEQSHLGEDPSTQEEHKNSLLGKDLLEKTSPENKSLEDVSTHCGQPKQDATSLLDQSSVSVSGHEALNENSAAKNEFTITKVQSVTNLISGAVREDIHSSTKHEGANPNKLEDSKSPLKTASSPLPNFSPTKTHGGQPGSRPQLETDSEELSASLAKNLNIDEELSGNYSVCVENEPHQMAININESGSVISDGDSADEEFNEHIAHCSDSDEDILPGARRPRCVHSDDDDEEEDDDISGEYDDDDFVDSCHDQNIGLHYSDTEDSHLKEPGSPEPRGNSSPSSSLKRENQHDVQKSTNSPLANKELELDADQDKKNPAYIPRTGRYFMHDYREDEEETSQENSTETKSRKDTKKWKHDRFRECEQAPRSTAELIRKYGYDIREGAEGAFSNNAHESSNDVHEHQATVDTPHELKPTDRFHRSNHRNAEQQYEPSLARRSMGVGVACRSSQVCHDMPAQSHGEARTHPSRPLRGRFTVGQRRPAPPSFHRGRSDPTYFSQPTKDEIEFVTERRQLPDHHTGRTNQLNSFEQNRSSESRNFVSKHIAGRQSYSRRDMEHRGSIHQNHPPRRSFIRPRGALQRENLSYSGRSATTGTQSKYVGSNQRNENVAPRVRDDRKPTEQGPKRYSALRQTTDYRSNLADSSGPSNQNEKLTQRSTQSTESQYVSNVHSVIPEEYVTYNTRQKFAPVIDEYGPTTNFIMDNMGSANRSDAHFHPATVSYSQESSVQPYAYDNGTGSDPNAYSCAAYPQIAPVDLYPITGIETYSEAMPVHPYLYSTTVDAYSVIQTETVQPYESSPVNRERRPLLGRRPLKPLEIKDPRDRCQPTSTVPDQTNNDKAKSSQEPWSTAQATEATSQDT
ncbi:Protein CASC3 [Fasciola hepatica]|uniref:Protein CASC3 n=1 Tax=Fasciola hepatica TaxID=6192 RepID=A0A4E0R6T3_FASHE|nr:Protein CASC3 [Fasciola hepatica]